MARVVYERKSCTKCGERKPLHDFKLQKRKTGWFPTSWCRACLNEFSKLWMREYTKRPGVREAQQAREKVYNKTPQRVARHREHWRKYSERPETKARLRKYQAEYRLRPGKREHGNERAKRWRDAHPEAVREAQRRHNQKPVRLEALRLIRGRRRAMMQGTVTKADWAKILARYGHRCAYCGAGGKMTLDHVLAVSKGGRHEPENVVPACFGCNSKKNSRPVERFLAQLAREGRLRVGGPPLPG